MPMIFSRRSIAIASVCFVSLFADVSASWGQAYCALRDPTRKIYQSWPQATSYKSIVRTIDEDIRRQVAAELPFTIHFNELGRHTLYLPVRNGRPLGLVHARSEAAKRGLVEVIWSLDPRLRVRDFAFQRCRSRTRSSVESAAFKKQLVGKSLGELRSMLTGKGKYLAPGKISVPRGSEDLAVTVLRSGIKTIAVTRLAWKKDLSVIRPLYEGYAAFPNAAKIGQVQEPYGDTVQRILKSDGKTAIQRSGVTVLRAESASGEILGHVIRTPWSSLNEETDLWWVVRNDMVIKDVYAEFDWPSSRTRDAFKQTKGLATDQAHKCSTAAEIVAAEVLLLSRHN